VKITEWNELIKIDNIDCVLFKSTEHLNASVKIKEMDALNTSDHSLVLATAGVDVKRAAPKADNILTKPRWGKCDSYYFSIANLLFLLLLIFD
jgi:hypothetical protein